MLTKSLETVTLGTDKKTIRQSLQLAP